MLGLLAQAGCVVAAPIDDADVIVVNTCGFLHAAREESSGMISDALRHKRRGRTRRVIVAGCLCNRDGAAIYERAGEIDALVGVNDRQAIVAAVTGSGRLTRLHEATRHTFSDSRRFRLTPRHTAYLRVAEGCSQRCTFCTIPSIRGPLRSKPPRTVLAEARELVADGAMELNIIAQDTTAYGADLYRSNANLPALLRSLDRLDGLRWIRLLYTYPRRFTDGLIHAIAECERVVKYVDLPLQHISDGILRRMGRGVSRKQIEVLLDNLRRRMPGIVLRTTFIVGFPGETAGQFKELLRFIEDQRFEAVGVFPYSREEGTPAASMPWQVPDKIKNSRARKLMLAQQHIAFAANAAKVGTTLEVLVDGVDAKGRCVGRHAGQAPDIDGVCYLSDHHPAGAFVSCTVTGWSGYDLLVRPNR